MSTELDELLKDSSIVLITWNLEVMKTRKEKYFTINQPVITGMSVFHDPLNFDQISCIRGSDLVNCPFTTSW